MRWKRNAQRQPRGAAEAPAGAPAPAYGGFAGDLLCERSGCAARDGTPCRYVDRRGRHCGTAWCPGHQLVVAGRPYCPRHGNILAGVFEGTILAAPLPDIDNRAPGLVHAMGRHVGPHMAGVLGEQREPGSEITARPVGIAYVGIERRRAWTQRWALTSHTGVSFSVVLLADEERSRALSVTVDGNEVFRTEPRAVTALRGGATEGATRLDELVGRMVTAVRAAVTNRIAEVPAGAEGARIGRQP